MAATLQPGFDRIVRHALLGVQFRDAVDGRVVAAGLRVELLDQWRPRHRQTLAATASGVFALHAWPGMTGFGEAPEDPPLTSPSEQRFRLTVRDTLGRYVGMAFSPQVPSEGLWTPAGAWASPPELLPHVPLFSAVARAVPAGMCSLRVELRRAGEPEQAVPWVWLELWLGTACIARGMADEAGRALLVFPQPRARETALRTSPASSAAALEWTVTLRAFRSAGSRADRLPDFEDLGLQAEVALLQSPAPAVPLPALSLRAGETLQAARPPSSFVYVAE